MPCFVITHSIFNENHMKTDLIALALSVIFLLITYSIHLVKKETFTDKGFKICQRSIFIKTENKGVIPPMSRDKD